MAASFFSFFQGVEKWVKTLLELSFLTSFGISTKRISPMATLFSSFFQKSEKCVQTR